VNNRHGQVELSLTSDRNRIMVIPMSITQGTKHLQRIANNLCRGFSRDRLSVIAECGYEGTVPNGLSTEDQEELRTIIQDTALCLARGAMNQGTP
jgi:hypothetical protein